MKKIINGRKYDTETAQELGHYSNYGSWNDFNHLEEGLYRKKNGEFFLFGEGGARTRYARQVGSSTWSGGEEIRPLTIDEAREWAEKHLSADEYETIFGPVSEDDAPGKMMVTICISEEKWNIVKAAAEEKGIGVSEYIESLFSSRACTFFHCEEGQKPGEAVSITQD